MSAVLVHGPADFRDYRRLRDALDVLLADRLPDVEILTAGGPGVAALAASYARVRGLAVRVVVGDYRRRPGSARGDQLAALVAAADAVVIVGDCDPDRVAELARRLRRPLRVVGAGDRRRAEPPPPPTKRLPTLPD